MKIGVVIWCVAIVLVAIAIVPAQASNEGREMIRGKRTIHYLMNHFAQFFQLSNPVKINEKQDNTANPLKHLLMASSAQFSGGSRSKKPATTPKPFSGQFEIPSLNERLVQAETMATSGPARVTLLESTSPTEAPTEASTEAVVTEASSTTMAAPAPSEDPTTEPPTTSSPPTEEPTSEPEQTTVDPTAVNELANNDAESRDDNSTTQIEDNSIQTASNFVNQQEQQQQQQQQYRRPAWNPFPNNAYSQHPFPTYFGNNVFLPAPFIPQPFSHFGYQQHQPATANLVTAASSTSHSRVKMHGQPYDLVTYHGDSVSSPSSYQMQVFGKRLPLY